MIGMGLLPLARPDTILQSFYVELAALLAVVFGFGSWKLGRIEPAALGLPIVALIAAASAITSSDIAFGLTTGVFAIVGVGLASAASDDQKLAATSGFVIGVFISILFALVEGAGEGFQGSSGLSGGRSQLAYEATLALALQASPFRFGKKRITHYGMGFVLVIGILVAGGRGGIVAAILAFGVLGMLHSPERLFRYAAQALVVVTITARVLPGFFTGFDRLLARDDRLGGSLQAYSADRTDRYYSALSAIPDRPVGSGLSEIHMWDDPSLILAVEAHNFLLGSFIAAGWAGMMAAIFVWGSLLRTIGRRITMGKSHIGLSRPLVVLMAWSAFTVFPLGSVRFPILFSIFVVIFATRKKRVILLDEGKVVAELDTARVDSSGESLA